MLTCGGRAVPIAGEAVRWSAGASSVSAIRIDGERLRLTVASNALPDSTSPVVALATAGGLGALLLTLGITLVRRARHGARGGRAAAGGGPLGGAAVKLFYSYAHEDEGLRDELEKHLAMLERQGLLETWHDRRIVAGETREEAIDENLERADIILLLVSADF